MFGFRFFDVDHHFPCEIATIAGRAFTLSHKSIAEACYLALTDTWMTTLVVLVFAQLSCVDDLELGAADCAILHNNNPSALRDRLS